MNKIETGCLAMVVRARNPVNLGKVGRIGKFIGTLPGYAGSDIWEFSTEMVSFNGVLNFKARECRLMRIDGTEWLRDTDVLEVLNDIKIQEMALGNR